VQLAHAMNQVMGSTQMGNCVLEVALCLSQQLLEEGGGGSSYAVGETVMARRVDGDFGEGVVIDTLPDGAHLVVWSEEDAAAKLEGAELMPFGSGVGLSSERRQRVAPAFILNNFLMKTAIPSNDLSRVQMVVRDGADVNCVDGDGNSPLIIAVSSAASPALIQFLISRGAHVNFVGPAGSALQAAAAQDNVEAVRCLLAHGADAGVVDLKVAGDGAAVLLREVLSEKEERPAAALTPLTADERLRYAADVFKLLLPALVAALGHAQAPKLHRRVLMVLAYVLQRSSAATLGALTPLQQGALLGALRVLLSSPVVLEQFASLRMLGAALKAWPAIGAIARRHGLEPQLQGLCAEAADSAETSQRARNVSLRSADVVALATETLALVRAAPAAAEEETPLRALAALPARAALDLNAALRELAALLVGTQAPSAYELQQSGTLGWLLSELGGASDGARWAAFEAAFGTYPDGALAQLIGLLHNALVACETLPVHQYAANNDGTYSLKPLTEPITICLHPLHAPKPKDGESEAEAPPPKLSIDALVRMDELRLHLLRTSHIADGAYDSYCARLLGCVVEERPMVRLNGSNGAGTSGGAPSKQPEWRRATVVSLRHATPLRLAIHTLRYESDGSLSEMLIAAREYRIVGRVPTEAIGTDGEKAAAADVADPDARIHTVTILCPEGLPVDFFLENVLSEVRRALRQAEPGCAPMTRGMNEDYGWRDRGWERGGAQFERALSEKLRDCGAAAVARRQTKHEAETLVARLQSTVMVRVDAEPEAEAAAERESKFAPLARVQGLVAAEAGEGAQWLPATVVESASGVSLVYDDGVFEERLPAYRVRPVPQPEAAKRLNPLAAIFMTFEQFLSSRDERRAEAELGGRDALPANLKRTLSAFNLGRVQTVGHVPADVLEQESTYYDDGGDGDGDDPMDTSADDEFDIAPMQLQVRYTLGGAEGERPPTTASSLFDGDLTLLRCLQTLRENSPLRKSLAPSTLGYHPGVTCDRTGQNPIVGNRYKLTNENYDVCEAEYLKMDEEERARYTMIPPPCFRKPKGCGPHVWHLWYSIKVSHQDADAAPACAPVSAPACAPAWGVSEVEQGLLRGSLDAESVLRELRRCASNRDSLAETSAVLDAPLTRLSAAQLMSAYREAAAVPRATRSYAPPVPAPAELAQMRAELSRCGVSDNFAEPILLLWLLSQRLLAPRGDDGAARGDDGSASDCESVGNLVAGSGACVASREAGLWSQLQSPRLSAKLQQQLGDTLAVTSGALPQWTRLLMRRVPALFSAQCRAAWLRSASLGVSRSLNWCQEQHVSVVRAAYAEELAALERAKLEAEVSADAHAFAEVVEQLSEIEDRVGRDRLGALKSDIARVRREHLLVPAERLMAHHAACKHSLEVQFEGESGFGSGVTQNFYSSVANELLKVGVHCAMPLWLAESGGADADGFIVHSGALFPRPLPPGDESTAAVCERFRFLGRLMAKACRDNFIVPLPLSLHFLHLVRGGTLSYAAFPSSGSTGGVASAFASAAAELSAIASACADGAERARRFEAYADTEFACRLAGMAAPLSLRAWLAAGACCFVCPITGAPLCDGGDDLPLTVHNLQEYVHLLAQLWLADGVAAQASAFRSGLEEVFPLSALAPFTLAELQTCLCGTMSIEWSEAELQRNIHPSGGYSKHSKVYQLLLDELQRMENKERRLFLNFVTACPHLPPAGLSMLEIEVLPQHNGGTFPTAQTCGNKLYLPEYDDAAALRSGLLEAFANADFGGLHERAVVL